MPQFTIYFQTCQGKLTLADRYTAAQIEELETMFSPDKKSDGTYRFDGCEIKKVIDWHTSVYPDRRPIDSFVSDYLRNFSAVKMYFEPIAEPELCVTAPY